MVTPMTTPEGVMPDNPVADDEPAPRKRRIIRIRTTAMGAVPQKTIIVASCEPPSEEDE
jgi:hypothetical protein